MRQTENLKSLADAVREQLVNALLQAGWIEEDDLLPSHFDKSLGAKRGEGAVDSFPCCADHRSELGLRKIEINFDSISPDPVPLSHR